MPSAAYLRAKLLPPRPAPSLLARPRLVERLRANLENPITLVTANAGSGKTTLVAEFVRSHVERVVWYQLDASDADPAVFLGYLATGIHEVFAPAGEATLAYIREAAAELSFVPERAVDLLLNELLDGVDQQLVVVLDDYHHLGHDAAVHPAVDRLLAYLPDAVHAILVSRDTPPLSIARLRANAALEVVDRDDLLFTPEETGELFRSVFGLELSPEQLAEYGERTHGWITALQLVRQVASRRRPSDDLDLGDVLRKSENDIFEYFAEEVFDAEPPEARALLLRAGLLERIELDACAELFPELDAARQLPSLVRRNVFLIAAGERGEEYRLHPLFRAFLRRRARLEMGAPAVAAEHARLAAFFANRGAWEPAIGHMREAGDDAGVAAALARVGGAWVASGKLGLLVACADAIAADALEAEPHALFYRAEAARLQGDLETAVSLLHRAARRFASDGEPEGEAEAYHALATVARRKNDFKSAFELLDRAAALSSDDARVRLKCANTRGLILKERGEWAEAEAEFRAALHLAEAGGDDQYIRFLSHNLGLLPMMRGDFSEALRWLRRLAPERGDAPLPQQATANLNVARCLLYRGETDAAERHLDCALELCQLFNLSALRGEIFETYGNLRREAGEVERAAEAYDRAGRAYESAGIDVTRRELVEERAILALESGDLKGALASLARLVAARERRGDTVGRRTAGLAYGRALVAAGELDAARRELEPALELFRSSALSYYEGQASLALAACDLAGGREADMLSHLARAVDLAIRFDNEYWLGREVRRDPSLFAHADAAALLPADMRVAAERPPQKRPPTPPARASSPERPAAGRPSATSAPPAVDLTIEMLGAVEVYRDPARPFAPDAWATRRAREILCYIASRPLMRAPKELIVDTFWGEDDFETVQKNFHPTVSYIRKALNSRQPLKLNFLLYRAGEYMLSADHTYRVDVHDFERLLAAAEDAKRTGRVDEHLAKLEQAVALYRGEFMPGCYDEWAEAPRAYYRQQYLRAVETLAGAAQERGEWARSLDLAERILRDDVFREDAHCVAMRAYAAMGNRGAVKEQFETLRRVLEVELGVEPGREARRVFEELMG